jgi:magnesium transporter
MMLGDELVTPTAGRLRVAAEHLTARIPVAEPGATVDAVLGSMRGRRFDDASAVAVCEAGRLVGMVTIEMLLAAPPDLALADMMDPEPPTVAPGTDQERAAWQAVRTTNRASPSSMEPAGFSA